MCSRLRLPSGQYHSCGCMTGNDRNHDRVVDLVEVVSPRIVDSLASCSCTFPAPGSMWSLTIGPNRAAFQETILVEPGRHRARRRGAAPDSTEAAADDSRNRSLIGVICQGVDERDAKSSTKSSTGADRLPVDRSERPLSGARDRHLLVVEALQ
jgi:hypothetical protein